MCLSFVVCNTTGPGTGPPARRPRFCIILAAGRTSRPTSIFFQSALVSCQRFCDHSPPPSPSRTNAGPGSGEASLRVTQRAATRGRPEDTFSGSTALLQGDAFHSSVVRRRTAPPLPAEFDSHCPPRQHLSRPFPPRPPTSAIDADDAVTRASGTLPERRKPFEQCGMRLEGSRPRRLLVHLCCGHPPAAPSVSTSRQS